MIYSSTSTDSLDVYSLQKTNTISTTSSSFSLVRGMFYTPPAGTYYFSWSGDVSVTNTSGQGEVAIFVGGTQQTALTRQTQITVTVVVGVLGVASSQEGASNITGVITVNGSQVIQVKYRSVNGQTVTIKNRTATLIRLA